MRIRPLITFAVGLAMAGGAVYLVNERLNSPAETRADAKEPALSVTQVVVAAQDLKFGSKIGAEHLRLAAWPADSVPEGAFKDLKKIINENEEVRVVLKQISRGEPVLAAKISGFGGRASMATMIPEDKRAYAVRVNAVTGVAGFLLPGDRVDVLLTRKKGSSGDTAVTDVILQNIVVRGVDQIADEDRNKPQVARTVTVEVTSEEAQKLALAMQVGTLTLALRNTNAMEKPKSRSVGVADLSDAPVRPAGPAGLSVRVRRGTEVSVTPIRKD